MQRNVAEPLRLTRQRRVGYLAAMSSPHPSAPSPRVSALEPFLAMEVMERAFELEAAGRDILHLEIGEPDGAPPPAALTACSEALLGGETRYTDSRGLVELREAICADLGRRFGVSVQAGRVMVTSGTSPALLLVFASLLEHGGEVLVPTPHYPCYPNFVRFCGGQPVFVPTRAEDGFSVQVDAILAARTERTRAVIVGSPANPTGAVLPRETLEALAAAGLPIVSDEIYDGLTYEADGIVSALEIEGPSPVYALDGFSKRYAMTGFRLGWVVAPEADVRRLQIMQQSFFISASRFVQHAGIAALEHGAAEVAARRDRYRPRRDRLVAGLRALGFGVARAPAGAFYVLADARRFGADSRALAFELLERAGVGVTPGIDFGAAAEGHLRFCFAVADETIDAALERLAGVLPEIERSAAAGESAAAGKSAAAGESAAARKSAAAGGETA